MALPMRIEMVGMEGGNGIMVNGMKEDGIEKDGAVITIPTAITAMR
ncbi:MAG: hypothetical protein KGI29_08540 [Pseudomonadota bacterium]|nr:hypothetical protein [Pseudomonadota bacterium]